MWELKIKNILDRDSKGIPPFISPKVAAALLLMRRTNPGNGFEILLTKRTLKVHTHRGQISLPGGFPESEDKDWKETAFRETREEIGVPQDEIEFLGHLRCVETKGGVKIVVYVGLLHENCHLKINPDEVDKIIFLQSEALLEKGFERVIVEDSGISISSIGLKWQGELIWGATARILEVIYQALKEPS